MIVKLLEKIKAKHSLTNYGLAKRLRSMGIEITTQGVDGYENARGMRLDVLAGVRELSGESWEEIGKMIDKEFLPKR